MKYTKVLISLTLVLVASFFIESAFFVSVHAQTALQVITKDTTWENDKEITTPIFVSNGATLTINEGVTITFNGGSAYPPMPLGIVVMDGALVAQGTSDLPVQFDTANDDSYFTLSFGNGVELENQQSQLRYVQVSNGGLVAETVPDPVLSFLIPTANAQDMIQNYGAVHVMRGNIHIENSVFKNNRYAAIYYNDGIAKVVNSTFQDNEATVFTDKTTIADERNVQLVHNWYDELFIDGPGATRLIPFSIREHQRIVDPVIVIPGIFGSFTSHGEWKIDPVFGTYNNLLESFSDNEYDDEYIVAFPYNWHASNALTAELLADRIAEVKDATGMSHVDIVAHSMGGLVARAYIEDDRYRGDVDQLITLATPHLGAPKAYLIWEAGEFPSTIGDDLVRRIVRQMAKENGYDSIFDYVHGVPVYGVRDLLPTYPYLYDARVSHTPLIDDYTNDHPRNPFLEALNRTEYVERLQKVEFTKIIGDTEESKTISGFNILNNYRSDDLWEHGEPFNVDFTDLSIKGKRYNVGDGTVPLVSAQSVDILANHTVTLKASHRKIVTDAIPHVIKILTDADIDNTESIVAQDILMVQVFSPVDVMVTAPDGKRIGTDPATGEEYNEIPGAFYTGNDTEVEFLTIPNPLDGEYTVTTVGTDSGEYTIETTVIAEDNTSGEVTESTHSETGTATKGAQASFHVEIADDAIVEESAEETEAVATDDDNNNDEDEDDDDDDKESPKKKTTEPVATELVVAHGAPEDFVDKTALDDLIAANEHYLPEKSQKTQKENAAQDAQVLGAEDETHERRGLGVWWYIFGACVMLCGAIFVVRKR